MVFVALKIYDCHGHPRVVEFQRFFHGLLNFCFCLLIEHPFSGRMLVVLKENEICLFIVFRRCSCFSLLTNQYLLIFSPMLSLKDEVIAFIRRCHMFKCNHILKLGLFSLPNAKFAFNL